MTAAGAQPPRQLWSRIGKFLAGAIGLVAGLLAIGQALGGDELPKPPGLELDTGAVSSSGAAVVSAIRDLDRLLSEHGTGGYRGGPVRLDPDDGPRVERFRLTLPFWIAEPTYLTEYGDKTYVEALVAEFSTDGEARQYVAHLTEMIEDGSGHAWSATRRPRSEPVDGIAFTDRSGHSMAIVGVKAASNGHYGVWIALGPFDR